MQAQGMNLFGQFSAQEFFYSAMSVEQSLAFKGLSHHDDFEVRFRPLGHIVHMAFVYHIQMQG